MITIKKLIKQNAEKQKLLNDENKKYYEDFVVYVRSSLLKDQRATEEILLEMLDHLLTAQADQKDAQQFFGKDPKALADEVIENLPQESWKNVFAFGIELILTVFAYYTVVRGIYIIAMNEEKQFYLGNTLLVGAVLAAALWIVIVVTLKMFQNSTYGDSNRKSIIVISCLIFVLSVGIVVLTQMMPSFGRLIDLGRYGVFSISCLLFLIIFIMKKIREQQ
jgi:DNA-binding ferritin-like protein (Dps family)